MGPISTDFLLVKKIDNIFVDMKKRFLPRANQSNPCPIVPTLRRHCPQLSIVGAGHARDEEAKTKHCSQNIAGMARSYGVIVALTLRRENANSDAFQN